MGNMMDQMFSAEESDRLNKLQTNYEWKRTMKRNAGNVNQFAHDMEKFNQTRNQNAFARDVETFLEY